ncbi:hypothetical protein TNCV_1033631 [Trichonephila clavipes]|nr:hypothetical protein TNCV_1033631 [Trichonephila clavipes]
MGIPDCTVQGIMSAYREPISPAVPRVVLCLARNASPPAKSIIYHPTNNGLEHANRSTPFGTEKGRVKVIRRRIALQLVYGVRHRSWFQTRRPIVSKHQRSLDYGLYSPIRDNWGLEIGPARGFKGSARKFTRVSFNLLHDLRHKFFLSQKGSKEIAGAAAPQGPREMSIDYLLKTDCRSRWRDRLNEPTLDHQAKGVAGTAAPESRSFQCLSTLTRD